MSEFKARAITEAHVPRLERRRILVLKLKLLPLLMRQHIRCSKGWKARLTRSTSEGDSFVGSHVVGGKKSDQLIENSARIYGVNTWC